MNENINKNKLKIFFIKLIAITFAIIIVINITYNLIFADKLENLKNNKCVVPVLKTSNSVKLKEKNKLNLFQVVNKHTI